MAHVFDIKVTATLEDGELLSRILDFKEDLHRQCYRTDYVTVSDPAAVDSALAAVSFSVKSKAGVAEFKQLIKKSLARHKVGHVVQVTRR